MKITRIVVKYLPRGSSAFVQGGRLPTWTLVRGLRELLTDCPRGELCLESDYICHPLLFKKIIYIKLFRLLIISHNLEDQMSNAFLI